MNVLPLPRRVTPGEGTVSLADAWKLDAPKELAALECLSDLAFLKPKGDKLLRLRLDPKVAGQEAYRLELTPKRIDLTASTVTGIIRGVQTLRQLQRQREVAACLIEDEPALAIRAMHLDFRPKMYDFDYLLRTINRLAELKYNFLLWEWEDKFPFTRRPEVVHPEALTPEQIDLVKARCAKYAIELMPLVQTFGHLQFVLSLERYAHLREVPDDLSEICPLRDEAVELVKDLVQDIIDAHPESRYIHLGADESWRMGTCPACNANCEKVGRSAHYVNHMRKLAQLVIDAGKTPVIWDDMLIKHPEAVGKLPRGTVLLDWHYHVRGVYATTFPKWGAFGPVTADNIDETPEVFRKEFAPYVAGRHPSDRKLLRTFPYISYFMDKGFEVIVGPSICCWGDPGGNPNHDLHVPNIWGAAASAALDRALGCALTSWEVRRHPWEVQYYGITLSAETMWHPHEGVRNDFDRRFSLTQYGIDDASIPKTFYLLDRSMDEERCDHYGRGYDGKERRWSEAPIAEQLSAKDEAGMLTDDAPPTANAARALARAEEALEVFRRFAREARHNTLDASFWELAARERIFRVRLFDVMRQVYLARKGGAPNKPALDGLVRKALADGDALYADARELWRQILSPQTLEEELLTRWGEPRAYLSGD